MGCDIDLYAEVLRDGRWELAVPLQWNPLSDSTPAEDRWEPDWIPEDLGVGASSTMFAILSNFGRCSNGAFSYIAEPRGFPRDASPELQSYHDWWDDKDVLAPSWLLLSELMAFDWQKQTGVRTGMVVPEAAHLFKRDLNGRLRNSFPIREWPEGGTPSYSGYKRGGVQVYWTETHASAVGEFHLHLIDKLRSYGEPDNVRIVFWYSC